MTKLSQFDQWKTQLYFFFKKNSKIKYSSNIIKYKIFNYKIHIYINKKNCDKHYLLP